MASDPLLGGSADPAMVPRYCFVFGCPRSGTSALTRLLHSHDNVVMGNERYKRLLKTKAGRAAFTPELFERDRFLDFRDEDTNVLPNTHQKHHAHYEVAERRFRSGVVQYVGDKVRADRPVVSAISRQFPAPRFVFIYRDLLRVASSFEVRARNPQDIWSANNGYKHALERWQIAFAAAASLERDGSESMFVVRYERLFNGESRTCEALFNSLGLEVTPGVRDYFRDATSKWERRQTKELVLTPDQQEYLLRGLDRAVLDRFDARFEQQLDRYGSGDGGRGS